MILIRLKTNQSYVNLVLFALCLYGGNACIYFIIYRYSLLGLTIYKLCKIYHSTVYSFVWNEKEKVLWWFGARIYFRKENKFPSLKVLTNFVRKSGDTATTSHVETDIWLAFAHLYSWSNHLKNEVLEFWVFMHAVQYGEKIWYFDLRSLLASSFQDGYFSSQSAELLYTKNISSPSTKNVRDFRTTYKCTIKFSTENADAFPSWQIFWSGKLNVQVEIILGVTVIFLKNIINRTSS